ncbi:hypothetical protein Lal_00018437 [Lupinus albus]|nr:hypothetical protein Lal_00018437 [Lupinus albus]
MLGFIYVHAPHSATVIDWNLGRKLSTLIVDNCTKNDSVIRFILRKIPQRSFIMGGKLFLMMLCTYSESSC